MMFSLLRIIAFIKVFAKEIYLRKGIFKVFAKGEYLRKSSMVKMLPFLNITKICFTPLQF